MKNRLCALIAATGLLVPGLVAARPITLTTTLKNYGGDGAYVALYLTDARGAIVRTLWVAGEKSKYYRHLLAWQRATAGKGAAIDGITGASVGEGRQLKVTAELADALIDAGYRLTLDVAVEDMRDSPREVAVPLTQAGAGKTVHGRSYIADFTYTIGS